MICDNNNNSSRKVFFIRNNSPPCSGMPIAICNGMNNKIWVDCSQANLSSLNSVLGNVRVPRSTYWYREITVNEEIN